MVSPPTADLHVLIFIPPDPMLLMMLVVDRNQAYSLQAQLRLTTSCLSLDLSASVLAQSHVGLPQALSRFTQIMISTVTRR